MLKCGLANTAGKHPAASTQHKSTQEKDRTTTTTTSSYRSVLLTSLPPLVYTRTLLHNIGPLLMSKKRKKRNADQLPSKNNFINIVFIEIEKIEMI